jgi:hypothetical protein
LASNLPESQQPGFFGRLFATWFVLTVGLLALAFITLPVRPDFQSKISSFFFSFETFIFFAAFATASWVAYRSAMPDRLSSWDEKIGLLFVASALGAVATHISAEPLLSEFTREMNLRRGDCGPILFLAGALEGGIYFFLARRLAPTKPRRTAFWIAISSGALGLFFLQFICDKDSFSHLFVWHLTPIVVLAAVSELVGKKALRW